MTFTRPFDRLSFRVLAVVTAVGFGCSGTCRADVITAFDFLDAGRWTVLVIPDGTAVGTFSATGGALTLEQTGGSGTLTLTASLGGAGSISTSGYTDIRLEFLQSKVENMELDSGFSPSSLIGDGFELIRSGDSQFGFTTAGASPSYLSQLKNDFGSFWNDSIAQTFGQSLAFGPDADNNLAFDGLFIVMQVNDPGEKFTLSNFKLTGTPIVVAAAVPEPTAVLPIAGSIAGLALVNLRRRQRRKA